MRLMISLSMLLLTGCGFSGNQQVSLGGTTNANINVVFDFIYQVEDLCKMQTLPENYATTELYNKAVADCTFSRLSTINLPSLCNNPGLTPQQLATCNGLSSNIIYTPSPTPAPAQ